MQIPLQILVNCSLISSRFFEAIPAIIPKNFRLVKKTRQKLFFPSIGASYYILRNLGAFKKRCVLVPLRQIIKIPHQK